MAWTTIGFFVAQLVIRVSHDGVIDSKVSANESTSFFLCLTNDALQCPKLLLNAD